MGWGNSPLTPTPFPHAGGKGEVWHITVMVRIKVVKPNRTFLTLLAIILVVITCSIFMCMWSIARRADHFEDIYPFYATQVVPPFMTNTLVLTAIHATETAKAYTLTSSKQL
jgi:hypothetical protein